MTVVLSGTAATKQGIIIIFSVKWNIFIGSLKIYIINVNKNAIDFLKD